MDLTNISKNDKRWREIAFAFSRNKSIADDLVQEMYLKVSKLDKEINDYYIIVIIKNLWINRVKKKKDTPIHNLHYLKDNTNTFEPDDVQYEFLKRAESLPFHQLEFLKESFSKSLRDIEKEFNINRMFIQRELKKAKNKIKKNETT